MNSKREYLVFILNFVRCIPHLIIFFFHKNKPLIQADMRRQLELYHKNYRQLFGLVYLFSFVRAFRNIFYYRIQPFDLFLNIICPSLPAMNIGTYSIGPGFAIGHGFASAIGAKSIGKNCTVYQQVTIGAASNLGLPTILDNVTIFAGAVIIGNATIGNNVVVGANATVFKDVPDNCTVLPGSSKVMRWKKIDSQTDSKNE